MRPLRARSRLDIRAWSSSVFGDHCRKSPSFSHDGEPRASYLELLETATTCCSGTPRTEKPQLSNILRYRYRTVLTFGTVLRSTVVHIPHTVPRYKKIIFYFCGATYQVHYTTVEFVYTLHYSTSHRTPNLSSSKNKIT